MDITLSPRRLSGSIQAIASKSQAHRLLICAAFSSAPVELICPETNEDIEATAQCLCSLGARITRTATGYSVFPAENIPKTAVLDCRESGSTLRFLLPVAAALGVDALFQLSGRLPQRPLSPLWEELERMGVALCRPTDDTISCKGQLRPGAYLIDGSVSSQYITGLLYALSLLPGRSSLQITGKMESAPYVDMTLDALKTFGISTDLQCLGNARPYCGPSKLIIEGDWSNGAFFLAANALGSNIDIHNLNPHSAQGDRAVVKILPQLKNNITVFCEDIPDLVPILSVVAACNQGATFQNIRRLRMKESDRVEAICQMLHALGASTEATQDTLKVFPAPFQSCIIDTHNDHRIAMAGAIAATAVNGPVTVLWAECVNKSYPNFWNDYVHLGGYYEQYIR